MGAIRRRFTLLLILLLAFSLSGRAMAAAPGAFYHPPALTILVVNAPADLKVTVTMDKNGQAVEAVTEPEKRMWETRFRLYREAVWRIDSWYGNSYDFAGAVLTAESGEGSFTVPVPSEQLKRGEPDDVLTLDLKARTLTVGAPAWRAPLLFLLRAALGMLAEAAVLYLCGFRSRRSWIILLIVTLISKGFLSWLVRDWLNVIPSIYAIYFGIVLVVSLAEIIAYIIFMDEDSRDRITGFAAKAAVLSGIVGFLAISFLPI